MLNAPEPDDYVLATGEIHSIREFVEKAFAHVGRRVEWQGSGAAERGLDAASGKVLVDGHDILSDYRIARALIGLVPQELTTDAFETPPATMRFSL